MFNICYFLKSSKVPSVENLPFWLIVPPICNEFVPCNGARIVSINAFEKIGQFSRCQWVVQSNRQTAQFTPID